MWDTVSKATWSILRGPYAAARVMCPPSRVATILMVCVANPVISYMGPYNTGDADTKGVTSHKVCPVPTDTTGLFVAQPDGITWQHYWSIP